MIFGRFGPGEDYAWHSVAFINDSDAKSPSPDELSASFSSVRLGSYHWRNDTRELLEGVFKDPAPKVQFAFPPIVVRSAGKDELKRYFVRVIHALAPYVE